MTHPCPFENSCHEEVYIEYLKNQTNWRDIILTFETMYFFNSTKRQKFRPVQIQRLSKRQSKCDTKTELCFGKSRKHCGKKRKCL